MALTGLVCLPLVCSGETGLLLEPFSLTGGGMRLCLPLLFVVLVSMAVTLLSRASSSSPDEESCLLMMTVQYEHTQQERANCGVSFSPKQG